MLTESKLVFSIKKKAYKWEPVFVLIFKKPMRSNQFLTENKGFECWQVLKLCAMLSSNTNVWAHTDTRTAAAEPTKVGAGEGILLCNQCSFPPWAGRSPHAYSATLCDAHILQDKTSSDTCSISPYDVGFLPWKKKKERSYFKGYHHQIICATEEQWFDSPDVLILGVLISEARAERLAHVKIQKDRFIKMWEWRTFLVAKILSSQCSGSRFEPWSGNKIPHATVEDPACCKEDQKSLMPQLWLGTAK